MKSSIAIVTLAALATFAGSALAKLPAPTDEAKAKAAETAAKAAHAGKVAAFQLCTAIDRVALAYRAGAKKEGKEVAAAEATPPCADPGAFVYVPQPDAPRPIEAAGAHSPATSAAAPPNTTTATSSQVDPKK